MKEKNSLEKIIGASESTTIEWKQSLSETKEIIKTISAFANTEGGKIFVGVADNGQVKGVSVGKSSVEIFTNQIHQNLDPILHPRIIVKKVIGKQIIIVAVKEFSDKTVLAFGRPYKRVGKSTVKMSGAEYERSILEKHKAEVNFDSHFCKGSKVSDIDKEKLVKFVTEAKRQRGLDISPSASVTEILERLKLAENKKITNAAILLFGKDSQKHFSHIECKAIRFKGNDLAGDMIDFKTFTANVTTVIEQAENFIFEHIPKKAWIETGKFKRQEKWLYPPDAIREALVNALSHRDYKSNGKVQIRIFDDTLEIWNPGSLPPPLTVEKLKKRHNSFPRNPLIAGAFFWIKYVEQVGAGTNKILKWCKQWGLPEPVFEDTGGSFVVTFRKTKFLGDDLLSIGLNERQIKAVEYVKENGKITNTEYQEVCNVSKPMATVELKLILDKKIFDKIGKTGRGTSYVLSKG